jgi:hypothetical protein
LQFSLQAGSPETFGYTLVYTTAIKWRHSPPFRSGRTGIIPSEAAYAKDAAQEHKPNQEIIITRNVVGAGILS